MYGIDRLVVADASIVPLAPSAPPNVTTMMLADHLSGPLLAGSGAEQSATSAVWS